jgi:predicted acylesterase/phospholipase RssA
MEKLDFSGLRVGLLFQGEFRRLGPHVGAWEALYDLRSAGVLPTPVRAVGGSAGAIIATAMAPMTKRNNAHVHSVVRNLKSSNIFSVPLEKKVPAVLAAGALSFPLINHLEPQMNATARVLLHIGQTALGIGLGVLLVRKMFASPSDFSNEPLRKLLLATLNHRAITRAATEVRIMATDIETGEHVPYSTREPSLSPSELVERLIASSTLPGTFPLATVGSRALTDAEVKTNFPIGELEDMDVVFVFCYSQGLGAHPVPKTKREHETAMWDIAKAEIQRYGVQEYERRREANPRLPEAIRITSQRTIPPLTLDSFNRTALERSIQLGYDIIMENASIIGAAVGRALKRRRARERP